jgi:quinolinate synthetase A subunit
MNATTGRLTGTDIRDEIATLKKERNAIILAHYYQKPEIQDLADYVGDSLELSRKAQATDADVIAFCGVRFMAETAKILAPEKTVILPDMAGEPRSHRVDLHQLFNRGEGAERHHRHEFERGEDPVANPAQPADHLWPRQAFGRLSRAQAGA